MTYELTTIAIACPTCSRSLVAEQPWDPRRVTTPLRVPEHGDVREALLEQPRCPGSHAVLHLVDLSALREALIAYRTAEMGQATRLLGRLVGCVRNLLDRHRS